MKKMIFVTCILFLASCASSLIDVDKSSEVTNINTTVGEELIDLKKALDAGAISEEEYNSKKEKILARESK